MDDLKKKLLSSSGGGYKPLHEKEKLKKPVERVETIRERAARQRRERQEELTFTQEDYDRYEKHREQVLERRAAQGDEICTMEKVRQTVDNWLFPRPKAVSAQPSTPEINPDNMYWPPYNFVAKDGEKEIHVRYTQDVVETTVLAPDEWKEFFDALDKTQNIGGAMKGTYDAFDTAKKLGGLGVTAYVKTHNGVDYLILKGYKQHMKTLLAGHRFKASNPQVVKLSLGALDSVKGMARYVKVSAPMEILVGSAINVLQYVLNDEYMIKDLGVDQAKLLVNAVAGAGAGLFLASLAPAFAATAVGGGLILVGASFSVWVIDKATDFQKKTVNKVLELLDD